MGLLDSEPTHALAKLLIKGRCRMSQASGDLPCRADNVLIDLLTDSDTGAM
jgi:tryptophanase